MNITINGQVVWWEDFDKYGAEEYQRLGAELDYLRRLLRREESRINNRQMKLVETARKLHKKREVSKA